MTDLIVGATAVTAGMGGMIALGYVHHKLPEWNARDARLRRMSAVELRAELTRCCGAIFERAHIGDRRGMRHAHRAMKPVMRALYRRAASAAKAGAADSKKNDPPAREHRRIKKR